MEPRASSIRILAASASVLVESGLTKWSIDRCAESAGCTKGLVLHYFGTRQRLLAAIAAELAGRRSLSWRAALAKDGVAALDALWDALAGEVDRRETQAILELRLSGQDGARLAEKDRRELHQALARALATDATSLPIADALEGILEGYQLAILGTKDREGVREAFFAYWLTYVR